MSETKKNPSPKTNYLNQCWSAVHTNQTLALDCFLSGTVETDDIPALMLHNQFSRFTLTFIDNSGNERKVMRVNIRAHEVPLLVEEYKNANKAKFDRKLSCTGAPKEEKSLPAAYTIRIRAGDLKGKTPAEILLADPSKEGELARHKGWLSSNLAKYPKNQDVIDAIDNALYLLSTGSLASQETVPSATTVVEIWRKDFKTMSSGSGNTRTNAKISISCDMESNNPWCFRIENSEHPLVNGAVDWNTVNNRRYGTIRLNDEEMANFITTLANVKSYFEAYEYPKAHDFTQRNSWNNR